MNQVVSQIDATKGSATAQPGEAAECAGGSIFRANVCKRQAPNLALPSDKVKVFSNDVEFATHHLRKAVTWDDVRSEKMHELFGRVERV